MISIIKSLHRLIGQNGIRLVPSILLSMLDSVLNSCMYGVMLPSDPSGKLDIALRYKQRNKSQQSDPPRLLFFFSILHNLYPSCILRQYVKPPGRDAADVDQQLLQEPDPSIRYRCSRTPMRGIE